MYGITFAIILAHATSRNVGSVRPQPLFLYASHFKRSNQLKRQGHYKCFNRNRALQFKFSIQSSVFRRYYCCESKTILYLDTVYCKFLLYLSVEINPFKLLYYSTQTKLVYLGHVYETMINVTLSESSMGCYWSTNS